MQNNEDKGNESKNIQIQKGEMLGRARGPGEKEDVAEFISAIPDNIKIGDFVYYELEEEEKIVLARIERRQKILGYPDFFLNSVEFNPEELGLSLGFEPDEKVETFKGIMNILGVYDEKTGKFSNARKPPKTGQLIYRATKDYLEEIFTPPIKKKKNMGYVDIGTLLVRENENVPVYLEYNEMASKHMAILANTGAGKSYTVGVILEEYASDANMACAVVFDIHSEYKSLEKETAPEFKGKFKVITPKVAISQIPIELLNEIITLSTGADIKGKMSSVLGDCITNLKKNNKKNFSVQELIDEVDKINDPKVDSTKTALLWRLRRIKHFELFKTSQSTSISDICVPGRITIFDLNEYDDLESKIVLTYFASQIYEHRMNYVKKIPDAPILPFPVSIFIEEAHLFVPSDSYSPTQDILKQIATGGRKFGVGLALITQRPGLINENVLSQCNTCILLKIMNEGDKKVISKTVEAASSDLIEDLSGLTPGQAVIVGPCIKTPALVKIRERKTKHGGVTPDLVEENMRAVQEYLKKQKDATADGIATSEKPMEEMDLELNLDSEQ